MNFIPSRLLLLVVVVFLPSLLLKLLLGVAHIGGVAHVGEVPPVAPLGATVLWGMMMLLGTKISNLKFKEDKMISPFQTRLATYLTASR